MKKGFFILIFSLFLLGFLSLLVSRSELDDSMIVDMLRGEPVAEDNFYDDLAQADIVYIGETHRIERHHQWQQKILANLIERTTVDVLGLEQLEQQYQPELDAFNRGELSFDQLAEQTDWVNRWSGYEAYRALLEIAQKNQVRVVALNANAEIIRKVGRQGLPALTQEERWTMPKEIDLNDPRYRSHLDAVMLVHMAFDKTVLDNVFAAQVLRDETMARRFVDALSAAGEQAKGVFVCGSGHLNFRMGIPDRVDRLYPSHRSRVVMMSNSGELELTPEELAQAREIELSQEHYQSLGQSLADYLLIK